MRVFCMNNGSSFVFGSLLLVAAAMLLAGSGLASAQSGQDPSAGGETSDESALSAYTMGVFLLESGRPQKAIPHLERAWQSSGNDEQIGNKLCEAYFRAGDLRSCGRTIDVLLELNEQNDVALLFKARISYFRGEEEKALEYLDKLRSFSEPSFEVERLVARIQLELGRYEDAMASYKKAIRIDSSYPVVHYRYGLLLRRSDRREEAEQAFKDAIELQPLFSEAVIEYAEMLIEDQRFEEAEAALVHLLEQDGEFQDALVMTANLYAEQGRYDEAIQLLEEDVAKDTLPRDGILLLGRLYYEAEDFAHALEIFKGVFNDGPRTPEMARVLGELSLKSGEADSALVFYESAIELEPDNYRNYLELFFATSPRFNEEGAFVIELSDEERTDLLDKAAARVTAEDFDGLYVLGVSHQAVDDYEQAGRFFAQALELRPDDDRVTLNLAGALERTGEYEKAEPLLARLHERKPDDPTICNFYGYLLALMASRLDVAEQLVRTALKHEPDNGYYVDSLGWVYFNRGEYEKAVIELEKASRLVQDDPVILEHLGDAYQSLKRFREALAAYERSMGLQGENSEILDKIDATRNQIGN
jgi:tetratricopeptide (TPR) repeat protein